MAVTNAAAIPSPLLSVRGEISSQRISFLKVLLLQQDVQLNAVLGKGGVERQTSTSWYSVCTFFTAFDGQVPVCPLLWDRAGVCCLRELMFSFSILWPH